MLLRLAGVLCLALGRDAAAAACGLFAHREAKKCYEALVYGIIDVSSFPVTSSPPLKSAVSRPPKRPRVQYRPPSSFFQSEQQSIRKRIAGGSHEGTAPTASELSILEMRWADAKRDPDILARFTALAKQDEEAATAKQDEQRLKVIGACDSAGAANERPEAYRLSGENESFIIECPVASTPGFAMCVDASGKMSTTTVQLMSTGTYLGSPVSLVQLTPLTGRRHQLRVHLSRIGFPIVGDMTYAPPISGCALAPRMMLHAHRLSLPLPSGHLEAVAPSPFSRSESREFTVANKKSEGGLCGKSAPSCRWVVDQRRGHIPPGV